MTKVTVEEFMKNPTASLDYARAGETVLICEVDRPVAALKKVKVRNFSLEPVTAAPPVNIESVAHTGAQLVAYWKRNDLIGTRSDIDDSQLHAREIRHRAEHRHRITASAY